MTASPITSEQEEHFESILARAQKRARKKANPGRDGMQRLFARSGEFENWFVAGFIRFTANLSDYTLAKSILGDDFITAEEIMVARPDVVYSPEQIVQLVATIPSEEALRSLKENGYGFMPQPPKALSLLDVQSKMSGIKLPNGQPLFVDQSWYDKQAFAKNDLIGSTGWLATKKAPVNGSLSKNWNEQNALLLTKAEHVPNAAEASWFITIFFGVRGVRIFENVYVRTSSVDSDGHHVVIGDFDARGLILNDYWDYTRHGSLGLASARKFWTES